LTPNHYEYTYGDVINTSSLGYTYSGFVGDDTIDNVIITPEIKVVPETLDMVNAGEYNLVFTSSYSADNYEIVCNTNTIKINPKGLSATISNADYTSGDVFTGFVVTYTGFINGDTESVLNTENITFEFFKNGVSVGTDLPISPGTYTVKLAENNGIEALNYAVTESNVATLIVDAPPFDVSAIEFKLEYIYDGTEHFAEIISEVPSYIEVIWTNNGLTEVGSKTVTCTIKNGDIVLAEYSKELIVRKSVVTITVEDKSVVYGEDFTPVITAISENGVDITEQVLPDITCQYFNAATYPQSTVKPTNVGTYEIIITLDNTNYDATITNGTLTIGKATYDMSSVVFDDNSTTYTGLPQSLTATNLPAGVTATYTNATNAGTHTITATFAGDADNYNSIADMTAELTILPAPLTVTAANTIRKYGEPNSFTATYSGFVNGETADTVFSGQTLSYTTSATQTSQPGYYSVTPTGLTSTNHSIEYVAGELSVAAVYKQSDGTLYVTINDAFENPTSGAVYIVIAGGFTHSNGTKIPYLTTTINSDLVIPSGVTLKLPYVGEEITGTDTAGPSEFSDQTAARVAANLKTSITVADDVTIDVIGTLQIGGLAGPAYQYVAGGTVGGYAQILMGANSTMNVTGTVHCTGYIKETSLNNGSLVDHTSGTISIPFVVYDFCGGTNTSVTYVGGKITPFSEYDLPNIQTIFKIHYGANLIGYCDLYAQDKHNTTTTSMVGSSSSVINLTSSDSYIESKYTPEVFGYTTSKGITTLKIYGNANLGSMTMSVMGQTVDTKTVLFGVSYRYQVELYDGTFTMDQKVKLYPGATVKVGETSTLNISGQISLYTKFDDDVVFASRKYPAGYPAARIDVAGKVNITGTFGGLITPISDNAQLIISDSAVLTITSSEGDSGSASSASVMTQLLLGALGDVKQFYVERHKIVEVAKGRVKTENDTRIENIYSGTYYSLDNGWYAANGHLKYDANGGTPLSIADGSNFTIGVNGHTIVSSDLTTTVVTQDGYEFVGWYFDPDGTDGNQALGAVVYNTTTLYAKWEKLPDIISVRVTFDPQSGFFDANQVVTDTKNYNDYVYPSTVSGGYAMPTVTREGYTFNGWYTAATGGTKIEKLTDDFLTQYQNGSVTLYAQWTQNTSSGGCVAAGTLITLADGTKKKVEELTTDDMLLVFNHETGQLEAANIIFIDSENWTDYEVVNLEFSDGTIVKVIYEHGFYDLTLNKYVYIDANNFNDYLGHQFVNESLQSVTLVNAFITTEYTCAYSPVTVYHLNYFTEGLLSMPGGIEGLFNIFEFDENMKIDEELMKQDIEKYGLYTYEDFAEHVPYEVYMAFPAAYFKVSVGKGYITWDEIIVLIDRYLSKMV